MTRASQLGETADVRNLRDEVEGPGPSQGTGATMEPMEGGSSQPPTPPEPGTYRVVRDEGTGEQRLEREGRAPDRDRTVFLRACASAGMRPSKAQRLWELGEGPENATVG